MAAIMVWAHDTKTVPLDNVGMIASSDSYGQFAVSGAQAQAAKYGFKLSDVETADPAATNVQVQMAKLQAAGATTVMLGGLGAFTVATLTSANNIGYHPYFLATLGANQFAQFAALPQQAYAKMYTENQNPWPQNSDMTKQQLVRDQPYAENYTLAYGNYYQGYVLTDIIAGYLKRAGKNLTRESFINAIYSGPLPGTGGKDNYFPTINIKKGGSQWIDRGVHILHFDSPTSSTLTPETYTATASIPGIA
jgi:hypothetical protein